MFSAASKTDNVSSAANYIEDVFSTYLVTTPGGSYTVPSGIDFTKDGGLVWTKNRTLTSDHYLYGKTGTGNFVSELSSNNTNAASTGFTFLTALSNGFTDNVQTTAGRSLVHWQFRKQAKFFDVVTYTGNGTNRTIAHNLGSVPGCIIVKRTDTTGAWAVYHRNLANTEYMVLNTTAAKATGATYWNSTTPTSTEFSLGTATDVNANSGTYVAYLFAHDAGGFGLTGTDNVISCGSFTVDGSGNFSVNLGYEPQWVMIKSITNGGVSAAQQNWTIYDSMRGFVTQSENGKRLRPNTTDSEQNTNDFGPTATGFESKGNMSASAPFIYIAIRRGPMKTPTDGTKVFSANTYTTPSSPLTVTTGFPIDLSISTSKTGSNSRVVVDRLRSVNDSNVLFLEPNSTAAETATTGLSLQNNTALVDSGFWAGFSYSPIYWSFGRAPSFFDEVCYSGTGSARTVSHNLGVAPELIIVKDRTNATYDWFVYSSQLTSAAYILRLDLTLAQASAPSVWNSTAPTSTVFSVGTAAGVNASGDNYVAYLFASCPGVSKVGSYTGNGTTQTINCGFAGGARFVLIKRTDSTGDWYVYDTARGMTTLTDPYLLLNSTAAEVATLGSVTTVTTGFAVNASILAAINTNAASYVFFAVA